MTSGGPSTAVGRVLRIAGGIYHVDDSSTVVRASLRGRLKRADSRIVSVGDLVELERVGDEMRIVRLRERSGALSRHGVSKRREQVIVANVDQVAVVVSVTAPDPDFLMVDRLLALAALSGIDAFLVVNKTDLAEPAPADGLEQYAALGVETLRTSAESGAGLPALAGRLAGRITVLSGQSGVGKSSLLNAIVPALDLRVGEISERRGRGRHTTVASALYRYPDGGYVADTPGLQYLALWGLDPAELPVGFGEIATAGEGCRFADCRHRVEPDCAVRAAVEDGTIRRRRLESYLRLLDEAEKGR
ncbi:ribosome small subunit-dependent GTPase A [Candidatus Palauibacter soopunensis]|uniref:ribosome small subunit-dependent GTPase A n=1 Tax=Candidatus Palauibacter soopunensis TaxID=3056739 RepID=UPI0023912B0C|nr:ribosome small subunit-dependent GTPase A [Candidatus Palauibacter soopunensis]MDE2877467.1 ribosome small subunit-dependent GTPase A [Candidatus Palauibacter soopunensis]